MRISLLLLVSAVVMTGCQRETNLPRAHDDIAVTIELNRSWVTHTAAMNFDAPVFDFDLDFDLGSCSGDGAEVLICVVAVVAVAYLTVVSVDYLCTVGQSTHVTIMPDQRADYRQRLYWGPNRVFLPAQGTEQDGKRQLLIKVSGDRSGHTLVDYVSGTRRLILR